MIGFYLLQIGGSQLGDDFASRETFGNVWGYFNLSPPWE